MNNVKNGINLYQALSFEEKPKTGTQTIVFLSILSIVILMNIAVISIMVITHQKAQNEKTDIENRISAFDIPKVLEQGKETKKEIVAINADIAVLDALRYLLDTTTEFKSDVYTTVNNVKPFGVSIKSVKYVKGVLSISCTTGDNNPPADYAKALEDSSAYTNISYKGFDKGGDGAAIVQFTLDCTLKGWDSND